MYNPRDSLYAQAIVKRFGSKLSLFALLKFGFRQELSARLWHRIRTLYPLNQFRYDKDVARRN